VIRAVSESGAEEDNEIGFFKDLAVYLSKMPYATATIFGDIVKAIDEELNSSDDINDEARATIKYFLGKLVRSLSVFFDTYDKPILKVYMTNPENLIRISQAVGEALRAYRLLVTEDLDDDSSIIEDIASSLDDASALIESAVTSAITGLTERLESTNCLQQTQNP